MAEQIARDSTLSDRDVVQSLARGLAVVLAFGTDHGALTLDEAAARTGFSRSATRRLLRTLMVPGLVTFDGHRYRPTSRLLDLGYAQQSRLSVAEVALPHCARLSQDLGRVVSVARLDGAEAVYLARVGTPRFVDISLTVGSRLPAHLPAIGRVLLAWLPEPELTEFLASETYRKTRRPADDLRAELRAIRDRGWCLVSENLDAGLSAVAAPIHGPGERVVAAINLSARTDDRTGGGQLEDAVTALVETAAEISSDLHARHLA